MFPVLVRSAMYATTAPLKAQCLLDTGASHSFVNLAFVSTLPCISRTCAPLKVKLATGLIVESTNRVELKIEFEAIGGAGECVNR